LLEVAADDGGAPRLEMAGADAVAGKDPAFIVDDPKFDAEHRSTRPRQIIDLLLVAHGFPLARRRAYGAHGRHLGHSPEVLDVDAALAEPANRRRRSGRPSDDDLLQLSKAGARGLGMVNQAEPDRWNASRVSDALLIVELADTLGPIVRADDELQPGHRRGIGKAPAAGMKHRHDRHHYGLRG